MRRYVIGLAVVAILVVGGVLVQRAKSGRFSGERAFEHVRAIVEIGERTPGSEGIEKARVLIESELKKQGWRTIRQKVKAGTPRGEIEFVNIRARFEGSEADWAKAGGMGVVASHYDTKFFDDFEFVGANDGGSSTGALMEMARVLAAKPDLARRIELVFFDGEENIGGEYTPTDGLFGSREYGRYWRGAPPEVKPKFGIVLDLVGDRNLNVNPPQDSPRDLLLKLYDAAEQLGHRKKFGLSSKDIIDDHVPLNQAGIPTLDVIDLDYPHWHEAGDTLDKISPRSLEITGRVVVRLLEMLLPTNE